MELQELLSQASACAGQVYDILAGNLQSLQSTPTSKKDTPMLRLLWDFHISFKL